MEKRLAIAGVLIVVIFVGGYFLFGALSGGKKGEPTIASTQDAGAAPSTAVDAAAEALAKITVSEVKGKVERKLADGSWAPVSVDDKLSLKDEIRTKDGATAVLQVGDRATVNVAPRTGVSVAELSNTLSRIRLQEGRISTKVRGRKDLRLRVEVAGSDAVAETDKGEFSVLSSGKGDVTVAASEGKVDFSAKGKSVEVKQGEQSVAAKELAPSPPKKIPAKFFLKVRRPGARVQRNKVTTLYGTTAPGAVISINGVRQYVGKDGRFKSRVTLREGRNRISVVVEDVSGRRKQKQVPVTVDSKAPAVKTGVDWK